jgi:hypothetical protein
LIGFLREMLNLRAGEGGRGQSTKAPNRANPAEILPKRLIRGESGN